MRDDGLQLITSLTDDVEQLLAILDDHASRRVHGAMVVPPTSDVELPDAVTRYLPVATIVSKCGRRSRCHIDPDETATGRDAVNYLRARGHRRIAHVTYQKRHSSLVERAAGYEQQMEQLGLSLVEYLDYQLDKLVEDVDSTEGPDGCVLPQRLAGGRGHSQPRVRRLTRTGRCQRAGRRCRTRLY